MSEIISDKDIKAPLDMAQNFNVLADSVDKVTDNTKKLQQTYAKVDTITNLKKETGLLVTQQQELVKVQSQMSTSAASAKDSLSQLAPGLTSAASGFMSMTKAALAFIATPIGVVVAALGAALYALSAYFKSSEAGQNKLNKIMAVGSAIMEQFMNVVEDFGEAIFNAISNPKQALIDFGNLLKQNLINRFMGLLELIPALGKSIMLLFKGQFREAGQIAFDAVIKVTTGVEHASDKLAEMVKTTIALTEAGYQAGLRLAALQASIDKKERALIVERARVNLEVAKLREKAATLEGDAKRKALEEAIAMEQKLSDKEVGLAKIRLDLAKEKVKTNGDDKEALNDVAEAEANLFNARKMAYDNTLKFQKQLEALRNEVAAAEAKRKAKELKDAIDGQMLKYQQEYNLAKQNLDDKVNLIKQEVVEGKKTKEDGDKEILALEKSLADEYVQIQIDKLQKVLAIEGLNKEEQVKVETELQKLKLDLQDAYYKQVEDKRAQELKKTEEFLGNVQTAYSSFTDALGTVVSSFTDARLGQIDKEQKSYEDSLARQIAAAGDNEEQKKKLEEQGEKRRQEFEKKRIDAQRRAAIFDKIVSAIQAGIATALAVTKLGVVTPMAIAAGIAGAIEVGAILAKQIPQYEDGIDNHPGGLAVVGDGKGPERISIPGRKPFLSPSVPTLLDLPAGTRVDSYEDTMGLAMTAINSNDSMRTRRSGGDLSKLARGLADVKYAIEQKPVASINISRQGVEKLISNAHTKTYLLNTLYR
jgi:hypothetical protein